MLAILAPGSRDPAFSKRLTQVVVTLFGLLLLTFFIGRVMPVDPVLAIVGTGCRPQHLSAGLSPAGIRPVAAGSVRIYLNNLLHGDLGNALLTGNR